MDIPGCPEHGVVCVGAECCCVDKHQGVMYPHDDMRHALAAEIHKARWNVASDHPYPSDYRVADAVMAVPFIADALRATKTLSRVRGIVAEWGDDDFTDDYPPSVTAPDYMRSIASECSRL